MISRENLQDLYPLGPLQEGMLFQWLLSPDDGTYVEQMTYRAAGRFDVARFEAAWNELARRHDVLRTVFVHEKAKVPLQMVLKSVAVPMRSEDLRALSVHAQTEWVEEFRRRERLRGFDLARELPYRLAIVQLADESFKVVWTFHHIIVDGWSVELLLADLRRIYCAVDDSDVGHREVQVPYSRYIQWLLERDSDASRQFWRARLDGFTGPSSIPSSLVNSSPRTTEYVAKISEFAFDEAASRGLSKLALDLNVTVSTLLQALWAILLCRYQSADSAAPGCHDLAYALVVSGRPVALPCSESMVGLFANAVPLRVRFRDDDALSSFVAGLQGEIIALQEHSYLPLADVQTAPGMLDHLVVFENYPRGSGATAGESVADWGFDIELVASVEQSAYDLNVVFVPGDRFGVSFYFNAVCYSPVQIERLFRQLEELLSAAIEQPNKPIGALRLLPEAELALLRQFTSSAVERRGPRTIQAVVKQWMDETPQAVAIIDGPTQLTYKELDERAAAAAELLCSGYGLRCAARVALVLERGAELPLLWLAILRIGGVLVPIDPALPIARIAFMIADSACSLVLTRGALVEDLSGACGGAPVHCVDAFLNQLRAGATPAPAQQESVPAYAYIIYTSGSTGLPKGVALPHEGVLNVMAHMRELHPLGSADRVVFFSSPSFDASIWEMCMALCHGATLVVADRDTVADPVLFGAFLRKFDCTVTVLPPSYIRLLDVHDLGTLKLLASAGEAADAQIAARLGGATQFANLYGPTEASIMVSSHLMAAGGQRQGPVPIGSPIPNVDALVLDAQHHLVPLGAPGELCVAGPCVAFGYLNRPDLTAEKFAVHPYAVGQRMYCTGDIVRWLDDGNLQFVGRKDDQVKLRGHRIELGEVQGCLLACPGVRQAAVIVEQREDGDQDLVAYVVPDEHWVAQEVRDHLSRALPGYMLPSRWVTLPVLPLTAQGKLDRTALMATDTQPQAAHSELATGLEGELVALWCSALSVDALGVHDNFFDSGGHSLSAVRLVASVRKELGHALSVADLFDYPTIAQLADVLRGRTRREAEQIPRLNDDACEYQISPAQQRLWLLHHLTVDVAAYNVGGAFLLDGELNVSALEMAFAALIERHEALRTSFVAVDGAAKQRDGGVPTAPIIEYVDVCAATDPDGRALELFEQQQARVFDLEKAPLVRVLLVEQRRNRYLLGIVLHHIVADGWSIEVLIEELCELYGSYYFRSAPKLRILAARHRDLTSWLNARKNHDDLAYWQAKLGGELPILDLPTDKPRPAHKSYRGDVRVRSMDVRLVHALRTVASRYNVTLFMLLVATVKVLLAKYSGQRDIVVGHPSAGRQHPAFEGQVGFFINTVVLRDQVEPHRTFAELLAAVRQTVLEGLEHQNYPFEDLVQDLGVIRDVSRHPIFDVMVTYEPAAASALALPGVEVQPLQTDSHTSKFDLVFAFNGDDASMEAVLEYSTDLYEAASIERMLHHLMTLFESVVTFPHRPIGLLRLLADEEWDALNQHTQMAVHADADDSIVSRFEQMAARHADVDAVVFAEQRLTYRQLTERARSLAELLIERGVGIGSPVALMIERSVEMVVAIIGIMRAGCAYLPLDPSLPIPRLAAMVADAGVTLLVTDGRTKQLAAQLGTQMLLIHDVHGRAATMELPAVRAVDAAYILYTSGSTGRPNGVLVEHRNVLTLLDAYEHVAPRSGSLVGIALCPFSFDVSIWEMFSCLCFGGTLHVLEANAAADPAALVNYIRTHRVTSAYLPPAVLDDFGALVGGLGDARATLDRLLVGVEPIRNATLATISAAVTGLRIVNGYGPTEATVCSTFLLYCDAVATDERTPIGQAARGYLAYILDDFMQHVADDVVGEVYVGGGGLSRGYVGNPGLTAQRFVPHPFSTTPGARLYRTGDRARRRPDGNLVFVGRVDYQVKIRGFRVEPGEIEAALRAHANVTDTVVVERDAMAAGRQLVAYVAGEFTALDEASLRQHLQARLADYMMPAAIVMLDHLPRTAHGKIDRAALPEPLTATLGQGTGAKPTSLMEEQLLPLWAAVLERPDLGCDDDFFAHGGYSLLAMRLLSRIREACGVELPLRDLFDAPTVRGVAARMDVLSGSRAQPLEPPIRKAMHGGAAPLSFAQRRLWFLEQLEPGSAYNVPIALELLGELSASRLESALNALICRHESLRTRFVVRDGVPIQQILAARPIVVVHEELALAPNRSAEDELVQTRASILCARPFDLANDELIRALLLKLGQGRHALLLSIHHIVVDGWSMGVFLREVSALYAGDTLSPLAIQYADYASWQQSEDLGQRAADHLEYWREALADLPPMLALPVDRAHSSGRLKRAGIARFRMSPQLLSGVRRRAREVNATSFMFMLAVFKVVLARISGQRDIAVGTALANRSILETQPLIGFFANTVVLRTKLDDDPTFAELVSRVRDTVLGAYAHQDVPFEAVVDALQPQRCLDRTPLFQVLFLYQDAPLRDIELEGLQVRALAQVPTTAKFDLTLALEERENGLQGAIEFDSDLFDPATMEDFAAHFSTVAAAVASNMDLAVSRLPLLSAAQQHDLDICQPQTATGASDVLSLFDAQVRRTPSAVAIEDGAAMLSYTQLDRRANQLAHHLCALGAGPDVPIALNLRRSADLLVALLGIVKSGATVVPLDPGYPQLRATAVLEQAGIEIIVGRSPWLALREVDLVAEHDLIASRPTTAPALTITPANGLYILFTSGSTGVPKGVLMPHRAIANLVIWGQRESGFNDPARTLQFTPLSFDVAFQEIFSCWASGGTLVVIDEQRRRDAHELLEFLTTARIERLFLPFVALQGLAEAAAGVARTSLPGALRQVVTAGEQLQATAALVEFFEALGNCELHNHYGPTETHVITAHHVAGPPSLWPDVPPIGRAVSGARLYVLDEHQQRVPFGVPGELFAGGEVLSRGYINRPELTAERFVPEPYRAPGVAYRTGDLVKLRRDGIYEYLGRNDRQFKIRGYRIEPGEIETVLTRHPHVAQAVVGMQTRSGFASLLAYIVPVQGKTVDDAALRQHVKRSLPEYMVPGAFAEVPALPLTATGKVDHVRLASSGGNEAVVSSVGGLLRTETERALAALFAQVLEVPAPGADASFFDLGGHSLLATRLIARVRKVFAVQIGLRSVFEAPSVAGLAQLVDRAASRAAPKQRPLTAVARDTPLPLSFAQERLWFLDALGGSTTLNMPAALRLIGELDANALQSAIEAIVERHEILRSRYLETNGSLVQIPSATWGEVIRRVDLSGLDEAQRLAQVELTVLHESRAPFDLATGPVLRVVLLREAPRQHVMVVVLHHIVADGWSLGVFTAELGALYSAAVSAQPAHLPHLPVQYADFAVWQRRLAEERPLQAELEYWSRQLAEASPAVELPLDRRRDGAPSWEGAMVSFVFDTALTDSIRALAREVGATLHATLLTALALMLYRFSGQDDMTIGTPVGHRPLPELELLIGPFLNVLPIRIACQPGLSVAQFCSQTQNCTLEAFAHGDLPFEQIVAAVGAPSGARHTPLFNVMFVMQNMQPASLSLADLAITAIGFDSTVAKYDLTLAVEEYEGYFRATLEYASDLFDAATAEDLALAYTTVVSAMTTNPHEQLLTLPLGEAPLSVSPSDEDEFDFAAI